LKWQRTSPSVTKNVSGPAERAPSKKEALPTSGNSSLKLIQDGIKFFVYDIFIFI
jgi:hypothetical protein